MIFVENLTKRYGDQTLFENLSLHLKPGSRSVVFGPSGRGKTTFLRLLAGLEKPDAGRIRLPREGVAYQFQEPRLFPSFSAMENLLAVRPKGVSLKEVRQRAEQLLTAFGLSPEDMEKLPAQLSGGMQQRVALVRALLSERPVLLLDEPFRGLDGETRETVVKALLPHLEEKTLVLVTHDRRDAADLDCRSLSLFA